MTHLQPREAHPRPVAAGLGILLVAISAPAVANAATLTASDSTPSRVDGSSASVTLPIVSSADVGAVRVTLDFEKDGAPCSGGTDDAPFHEETQFTLTSPSNTTVAHIAEGAYGPNPLGTQRVSVTLDADATAQVGGGASVSGTFRPSGSFAAFAGQPAGGTCQLTVTDAVGQDPLCSYGSTLTVVEAAPVLVAGDLPRGAEGAAYSGQIPAATAAGAVTYAATDPAALPLSSTGAISGTPTASGVFDFAVTAADAIGTSQPRTYTIVVEGAPSISGAASANATVGTAFSYAPVVDDGELPTTFPTASPHTITATHIPTGVTAEVIVEVVPAPTVVAPTPSAPGVTAPAPSAANLPTTGADGSSAGALLTIAAMLLVAGFVVGMRRRRLRGCIPCAHDSSPSPSPSCSSPGARRRPPTTPTLRPRHP